MFLCVVSPNDIYERVQINVKRDPTRRGGRRRNGRRCKMSPVLERDRERVRKAESDVACISEFLRRRKASTVITGDVDFFYSSFTLTRLKCMICVSVCSYYARVVQKKTKLLRILNNCNAYTQHFPSQRT